MTRSEMMLLRALLNRFKAHMEKEEEPHSVEHEALEVDILNVCGSVHVARDGRTTDSEASDMKWLITFNAVALGVLIYLLWSDVQTPAEMECAGSTGQDLKDCLEDEGEINEER